MARRMQERASEVMSGRKIAETEDVEREKEEAACGVLGSKTQ